MISQNSLVNSSTLAQIIENLGYFLFEYDLIIDSRKVNNKSIFCAYPGVSNDGRNYIENALNQGAKAILYESGIDVQCDVLHIPVKNLMYYVGPLAAQKYNKPSEKFLTIGVTGTNGKTSITHWLNQIYSLLGKKTAIIGTTGAGIYPNVRDYASTTPDPITLQKLFSEFVEQGVDITAMEVSSHSLHQGRVNGTSFKTAIFTNLTQDHLDYHKTMREYYLAKRDLFYWHGLEHVVVNTDDKYGVELVEEICNDKLNNTLKLISYGINSGDLRASYIKINFSGMSFTVKYDNQQYNIQIPVIGKFNVYNILAVIGCLLVNGHTLSEIVPLLASLKPVCGRMDTIIAKNSPLIVIDYAHTPDALENALNTLKEVEHKGKLYCVFGCGGNRDAAKRPIMGDIATKIADFSYITSDNPRNEEPDTIIKQIVTGINNSNYKTIINRESAIAEAIKSATSDDVILIAGKGHETYQEIKGVKHHFSDFEIARYELEKLGVKI